MKAESTVNAVLSEVLAERAERGLTLMESSCCLKASSASLLGENIRLCRVLFGGSVVGTANTPPSESAEPSSERGRLRPPGGKEKNKRKSESESE